ncbi:MAG TPA: hypothetical protein VFI56_08990, partial [Vicinamibacterales bacterium]|nr:hypothetical protein [Vicinamibacterales bacterium]
VQRQPIDGACLRTPQNAASATKGVPAGHSDESINHCGPTFEAELDGGHGFRAWAGYVRSERLPRVARATGFTHAQTDRTRA